MVYDTEIFEVTDVAKFSEVFESYRGILEEMGATDIKLLKHTNDPGKVLIAMWWKSAEACRAFNDKYHPEIGEKVGPITKSMQPDDLWERV